MCILVEIDGERVLYDLETGTSIPQEDGEESDRLHILYSPDDRKLSGGHRLDVRCLARVLFPELPDHSEQRVRERLGLTATTSSAGDLVDLLGAVLAEAASLSRESRWLLESLLPQAAADVLSRLAVNPVTDPPSEVRGANVAEAVEEVELPASGQEALSLDGQIAAGIPGFEERAGQRQMTAAVEQCLAEGGALVVDAPPGIGKTFAYLVPVLLHLLRHPEERVVVSTRTRQLQEQLFLRDLPYLAGRLAPDLKVAMLKGRENYLCMRRWARVVEEQVRALPFDGRSAAALLVRWLSATKTGDIEENHAFLDDPDGKLLWPILCDSPYSCTGRFCGYVEDCFSVRARRAARRAQLVIVNHALLLGDCAVDGAILGSYDRLVVDEAHTLEAAGRAAMARQVMERSFTGLADDLAPSGRGRRGWLHRAGQEEGPTTLEAVAAVKRLRRVVRKAFADVEKALPSERRSAFSTLDDLSPATRDVRATLGRMLDAVDALREQTEEEELLVELEGATQRGRSLEADVEALSSPPNDNTVHWVERTAHGPCLVATPLDIAPMLSQLLYAKVRSVVMTSATMALGESFDVIRRSLGLNQSDLPVRTLKAETPFSYGDRMRILVPRYAPPAEGDPERTAEFLATLIESLSARIPRRGLALFTSHALLRAVQERVDATVTVLAQGGSSRSALLHRFKTAPPPVWLLGTETFWEGVDLPGDDLELLLISRLPFPVPTDPVFAARCRQAAERGEDPFLNLSVSTAALRLRQGVGRLVRTQRDRGVVILTDHRIVRRSYGEWIERSMPVRLDVVEDAATLLDRTALWFGEGEGSA